jgi:hypothetical protein
MAGPTTPATPTQDGVDILSSVLIGSILSTAIFAMFSLNFLPPTKTFPNLSFSKQRTHLTRDTERELMPTTVDQDILLIEATAALTPTSNGL